MRCEICSKEVKNIKAHERMAHPELALNISELPLVKELQQQVDTLQEQLANIKQVGKSVEQIARILYDEIVKPLCKEKGMSIDGWENIDRNDYLRIARNIKG